MGYRYYVTTTIEALKERIEEAMEHGIESLIERLGSDIKVKFGLENWSNDPTQFSPGPVIGYQTDSRGFVYCGFCAGADWEAVVFFIVYWDGRKLRAYIPKHGNLWNTKTKQAYGNDREADRAEYRRRWPERFVGQDPDYTLHISDIKLNAAALLRDIKARIVLADGNGDGTPYDEYQEEYGISYSDLIEAYGYDPFEVDWSDQEIDEAVADLSKFWARFTLDHTQSDPVMAPHLPYCSYLEIQPLKMQDGFGMDCSAISVKIPGWHEAIEHGFGPDDPNVEPSVLYERLKQLGFGELEYVEVPADGSADSVSSVPTTTEP